MGGSVGGLRGSAPSLTLVSSCVLCGAAAQNRNRAVLLHSQLKSQFKNNQQTVVDYGMLMFSDFELTLSLQDEKKQNMHLESDPLRNKPT